MECFVSNALIETAQVGLHPTDFGQSMDAGILLRGHLSVDEVIAAAQPLYARFMKDSAAHDGLGPEFTALIRAAERGTSPRKLGHNLPLGLRVFRELMPHAFLSAVLPRPASPRYLITGLEELRGVNERIVFSGVAVDST